MAVNVEKTPIKERWVKEYYDKIWQEADRYFTEEVVGEWWENMSLYHNVHSRANKLAWQADVKEPVVKNLIDKLSNFLTRALVSDSTTSSPFFKFEIPNNKPRAQAYTELVNSVLESNKWTREVFNDSLKKALITSPYINKVVPVREMISMPVMEAKDDDTITFTARNQPRSRTRIKSINPFDIRLDPYGNRYIVEIERSSVPEILEMAKEGKWFNVETALAKGIVPNTEEDGKATESDDLTPDRLTSTDRAVLHHVYAKNIAVNEGKAKFPEVKDSNVYFIMLNGVLVHYTHNLLPKGRFPYVVSQPISHIVGRYGKGFISMLKSVICEYMNMLSLTTDEATINILPVYERDREFTDPESADANAMEITPGHTYMAKGGQSLRRISNPSPTQTGLQMVAVYDTILQNRSSVTEFFEGRPTAKGRPTLGEVELKTNRNDSFVADLANEIESNTIEELLELVLDTELVYLDDPDRPKLESMLNSSASISTLANLEFKDRMDDLLSINVSAKGISHRIEMRERFGALVTILQVLGNFGEQGLQKLSLDKIVEFLFRTQSVPVEELTQDIEDTGTTAIPGTEPTVQAPAEQAVAPQAVPQGEPVQ